MLSPSAYNASTVLHPQWSGPSAGAAPGMSCVAGEVCCMPSFLIQGKLCPRDQQFGRLPKQQPAESSCAAALPATHHWAETSPSHPQGRALKLHLTHHLKNSIFMSPFCWQTQHKGPRACCYLQRCSPYVPAGGRGVNIPGRAECAVRLSCTQSLAGGTSSSHPQTAQCKTAVDTLISDYKCQFSLACQQKQ